MSARCRVLLVAPHFPPETVAAAARLGSLAAELQRLGHEVRVAAPTDAEAARPRGALRRGLQQYQLITILRRRAHAVASSWRPQVVLTSSPPPVVALAGLGAARSFGVPLVLDVRDIWPDVLLEAGALRAWSPATLALRAVERKLLRGASALITVTDAKARKLASRMRAGAEVVVAPNGVDAAWLEGVAQRSEPAAPVALCAGNVGLAQDVALLVQALALPGTMRGVVVGDGEELPRVRALAERLRSRVAFESPVPRDDIRSRLLACTCAVVTLRTRALGDSVPSKLLEAMALGVPIVAVVAGEAADIVRESGGGVVVDPGDAPALARALESVSLASPSEREAMGARGRAFVLARFRRERSAGIVSELLQRVAARGR